MDKRSRPMIGKISELLLSGNRATVMDVVMSPRSPLELKIQSPRGVKNYDLGGIGLGILAALDKTGYGGSEILAKYTTSSPRSTRSDPIAVNFVKNCTGKDGNCFDELETDSMEDYTYVTCHGGPKNNSFTRVYCEKGEDGRAEHDERRSFNRKSNKTSGGIFSLSPTCTDDRTAFPATDFLSSCQLCKKNLHGKDIYIYRGEKAFCSSECRQRQITIDDDRKELCRSEASRSMDVSNSPYTTGLIFTSTILAS